MPRQHPNLLFLFTDEQRADTMAAYGNTRIEVPNLNRLSEESFVFERTYVSQPVCTPSRATILTGLWPHTNGCTGNNIPLPAEVACLPEMLLRGDYATGYHGKWHLGDELYAQHGFDEWVSIEDGYNRYFTEGMDRDKRSDYHHFLIANGFTPKSGVTFSRGEATRLPEEFGKPAFLAREASRFIRENRGCPFCLFVNFLEPHMPFYGPRDDQHLPQEVTLPANFDDPPDETNPLRTRLIQRGYYEKGFEGNPLRTEADWRRMIANYWGLCSLVDAHVGTILRTLDECGLTDETIIVYTSDHGDMMGSHRLIAKTVMFEEAARVPLLIRLPGQRAQRHVAERVSQIDLVPTLLELTGQPIPGHLEGKSLVPCFEPGDARPLAGDVIIEWNTPRRERGPRDPANIPAWEREYGSPEQIERALNDEIRGIVTPDGWKFNWSSVRDHELYNLNEDPYETRNLARHDEHRGRMRALTERIRRWQEETEDVLKLPEVG